MFEQGEHKYNRVKELTINGQRVSAEVSSTFGDDRGYFGAINFKPGSKRAYLIKNHRAGTVRAFHGHKNERKTMYVLKGAFKVIIIDMESGEWMPFTLTEKHLNTLDVPNGAYNGFVSLTDDSEILIFSSASFEESVQDDHRLSFDILGRNVWGVEHR
jgi:dTDP-4-dehydrorhamnose 3,5-epimerase-like enzyme